MPLPAEQLVGLYVEEGPNIFDRSLWQRIRSAEGLLDEKYDSADLDRALERFLVRQAAGRDQAGPDRARLQHGRSRPLLLQEPQGARGGRGLHARRGGARHLGGADLLRAVRAGGPGARRRRRVRGQPGDVRRRRGAALPAGRGDRPAVARHRPAYAQAQLRRGPRLGSRGVGQADPRRGLRRASPTRSTTSSATSSTRSATGVSRSSSPAPATTSTTRASATCASCAATPSS